MFGFEQESVYRALAVLALIYFGVMFAVGCDLVSGIKKAKKRGEMRRSNLLRMTVKKLSEYWNVLLAGLAPDIICYAVGWYDLPFATAIVALFIVGIEIKSIYEKAENKKKYKEVAEVAGKVVVNRDNIEEVSKALNEYFNNKDDEKGK